MASTTTRYKLSKPTVSGDSDVWGGLTNTDWDALDVLLSPITTAGSSNAYTLTSGQSLAAYVDGQSFWIKASFANTGGATLNVDGIGAKNLRKLIAGTLTALASGDIASGDYLRVTYNSGSDVIVILTSTNSSADLDPTLAALAVLSWSSGIMYPAWTAADTIALTASPQIATIELGNASDTTLSRSAAGKLAVEGVDVILASGTQNIGGNKTFTSGITTQAATPSLLLNETGAAADNKLWYAPYASSAALHFATVTDAFASTDWLTVSRSGGSPTAILCGAPMQAPQAVSSETGGTLTNTSRNTTVVLASAPTIDGNVFAANAMIYLYNNSASSRVITQGSTGSPTQRLRGSTTTGNLTLAARGGAFIHFVSATEWTVAGDVS